MSAIELLPCPFCGGEAEWVKGQYGDGFDWHYVACSKCEAAGPSVSRSEFTRRAVTSEWNRRADLAPARPSADYVADKMLRFAAETFCHRVEIGEIRSKRSYAMFKDALAARPVHPAADTRVVGDDDGEIENLRELRDADGFLGTVTQWVEYIIQERGAAEGRVTDAPSDKIAEAALLNAIRSLLKWDAERRYPLPYRVRDPIIAALRALAGKGE